MTSSILDGRLKRREGRQPLEPDLARLPGTNRVEGRENYRRRPDAIAEVGAYDGLPVVVDAIDEVEHLLGESFCVFVGVVAFRTHADRLLVLA